MHYRPLNMKDTVFALSEEQKQRLMQGHGFDGGAARRPHRSHIVGSGGLYSTPSDLLSWMQWHLDRFGESGAEVRLLDHSLYLIRDGLETVSGTDESGHMNAMGLAWVAMMPEGSPVHPAKGRRPAVHFHLYCLLADTGRGVFHSHQQIRLRCRHCYG
jgi:D-alanyl-D-alanine-carboxypeptidase/D-alanyl-D-alanine-endopeptidase